MSLDSSESPEEAGAKEPGDEADMLLDQAKAEAVAETVEVKAESPAYIAPGSSPDYIAPGSRSPSKGRSPSPLLALYSQVRGMDPQVTQASLEDSRKRREEEARRARARSRIRYQV